MIARRSFRAAIGFGVVVEDMIEYSSHGARVDMIKPIQSPALSYGFGFGGIALIDKAPHPNAAKVFINWILDKEVQTELDAAVKINSRHKGVPPGAPNYIVDVSKLDEYSGQQTEAFEKYHKGIAAIVREMPR